MTSLEIIIPERLVLDEVAPFLKELSVAVNEPSEITINFERMSFAKPIGTLILGSALKQLKIDRNQFGYISRIKYPLSRSINYLSHVGFWNYIGFGNIGKTMGEANGSRTYLPITQLNRKYLESRISPPYIELRHVIVEETKRLAKIIVDGRSEDRHIDALAYCLREIIRNVFEHSQADDCFLFGQKYTDRVEIGIIDAGIGVKNSLSSLNDADSDERAIQIALEPGLSRITKGSENKYDNSGYGLYVLSELGRQYGAFVMGSGTSQKKISMGRELIEESNFKGTYVGLILTSIPDDFASELKEIISGGEQKAHIMGYHSIASKSSRTLF